MKAHVMLLTMTIAVIGLAACNTVPINTNDQTVPVVEIKVKGEDGQYSAVSDASLNAGSADEADRLDIMCVVTDPDGLQSASLVFAHTVDVCQLEFPDGIKGTFPYQPVPLDLVQPVTPKNGKVIDKLLLLQSTIRGPYVCFIDVETLGTDKVALGTPWFGTIKAVCRGENWSSSVDKKSSEKTLWIHF